MRVSMWVLFWEDASTLLQTWPVDLPPLFLFFKPVGTTLNLKEEEFLYMLLLSRNLKMILAIVATCGLFNLPKKGKLKYIFYISLN